MSIDVQQGIAASKLLKTIEGDPACREAVRALLSACTNDRIEEATLIACVEPVLREAGELPVQPISSVIEMLVRHGALAETLEIDGTPYAGSIEDAYADVSIPDEAESLIYEQTTDVGAIVIRALAPQSRAAALFESEPDCIEGFLATLEACDTQAGISTKALELVLDERGLLLRDAATGIPTVYPSMFANMLKDAGCLEWNHAWITTETGREALNAFASCGHEAR